MKFCDILKKLREYKHMNQAELADALGVSRSTIGMYETGKREPDFETMEVIADFFNVSMDYLHGKTTSPFGTESSLPSGILPLPRTVKKPRLGSIACGEPILAEQNIETYDNVPEDIHCDFTLKCKGDSMIDARIYDGDIVYIRKQPAVENGEIAAVLIGDEATLKRVYLEDSTITLMPANPAYAPMIYTGERMNLIRILGKAVAFFSCVR